MDSSVNSKKTFFGMPNKCAKDMLPILGVSPQVFTCKVTPDDKPLYHQSLENLLERIVNPGDEKRHIGAIIWDARSESDNISWKDYVAEHLNDQCENVLFHGDYSEGFWKRLREIPQAPSVRSFDPEVCFAADASKLLEEKEEGFLNGIIVTEECRAKIESFDPSEVSPVEGEAGETPSTDVHKECLQDGDSKDNDG